MKIIIVVRQIEEVEGSNRTVAVVDRPQPVPTEASSLRWNDRRQKYLHCRFMRKRTRRKRSLSIIAIFVYICSLNPSPVRDRGRDEEPVGN